MATKGDVDIAVKLRGAREFAADSKRVERSIKGIDTTTGKASTSVGGLTGKTGGLKGAMMALGPIAAAAGGAVAAFGAVELKKSLDVTRDFAAETIKLNDVMGGSFQENSRLIAVANARGVSTDSLVTGNIRLSKAMQAARKGTGDAGQAFKDLGISQAALKSDNVAKVFDQAVAGFDSMDSGAKRNRAALALFGRSWVKLRPILKLGASGLKEQKLLAGDLGASLSGIDIKNAKDVKAAMRDGQMAMFGLRVTLGKALLPMLAKAAVAVTKFITAWSKGQGTAGDIKKVFQDVAPIIGKTVRFMFRGVSALASLWKRSKVLRSAIRAAFQVVPIATMVDAIGRLLKIFPRLKNSAKSVWRSIKSGADAIKNAFRSAINFIIRGWNGIQLTLDPPGPIGKFTIGTPDIPLLASGGNITRSGVAMVGERGPELLRLPRGAQVQPLPAGAGFGGTVVTKVYLDRRQIAQAVGHEVASRKARR